MHWGSDTKHTPRVCGKPQTSYIRSRHAFESEVDDQRGHRQYETARHPVQRAEKDSLVIAADRRLNKVPETILDSATTMNPAPTIHSRGSAGDPAAIRVWTMMDAMIPLRTMLSRSDPIRDIARTPHKRRADQHSEWSRYDLCDQELRPRQSHSRRSSFLLVLRSTAVAKNRNRPWDMHRSRGARRG